MHALLRWPALPLLLLALGACSGSSDGDTGDEQDVKGSSGAQMNDLTTVLPLPKSQSELDDAMIKASAAGVGGALLPKDLYDTTIGDGKPVGVGGDVGLTYADLRVVAVRLDPCFANIGPITDSTNCDNQLRLVFQSVTFQGGSSSAVDGAVHAFYSLSRPELTQIIKDIGTLRAASKKTTDLGPLAPHPLLASQGLDGAYGQGLTKIVLAHAGAKNLIRFTAFISKNLQTSWDFFGFDVAGGTTKPMVIPTLPKQTTRVNFFAGFGAPIAGGFSPATTSKDDVSVLVNVDTATKASADARQAAYDAALRIENPGFHSPNTIDCASCHVAQEARVLMGEGKFKLSSDGNANVFTPDKKIAAKDLKQTTSIADQPTFNVHMVSYKGSSLQINQRVINETAAIVSYVNGVVLKP
jgi:hypothetical protein